MYTRVHRFACFYVIYNKNIFELASGYEQDQNGKKITKFPEVL